MIFSTETIRSRQNRSVVELAKLSDRKARETTRLFRFDGIKLAREAMESDVEIPEIFLCESRAEAILGELSKTGTGDPGKRFVKILVLEDGIFERISEEKSPEGVICIAKYIDKIQKNVTIYNSTEISDLSGERIVLLESVRDPSNLGAVIRSAAAFGVDRLIISSDCADIYHPRTVRASMGTLFRQKIDRTDRLPELILQLRETGRRVFAAALDPGAERLGSFSVRDGDCVVIGNEGHGLSRETVKACRDRVYIPMKGQAESLNAAVAASLLMWEFAK